MCWILQKVAKTLICEACGSDQASLSVSTHSLTEEIWSAGKHRSRFTFTWSPCQFRPTRISRETVLRGLPGGFCTMFLSDVVRQLFPVFFTQTNWHLNGSTTSYNTICSGYGSMYAHCAHIGIFRDLILLYLTEEQWREMILELMVSMNHPVTQKCYAALINVNQINCERKRVLCFKIDALDLV